MSIKTLLPQKEREAIDFDAIRLKVASPEAITNWSHGEIVKPETINYRTQKPEKDGLFDERIFGPTKDFECYCGKYKRIRYKGIVCEKCGVEVTRSVVRRERMGHIALAAPVSHIWFLRGVPSKIGLLLDLSVQDLEKVIYFADFIVTDVNEELRIAALDQVGSEFKVRLNQIENEFNQKAEVIRSKEDADQKDKLDQLSQMKQSELEDLMGARDVAKKELTSLKYKQIISESSYHDLSLKYGQVFEASIGAEAIRVLLGEMDLSQEETVLEASLLEAPKSQHKRIIKRLKLVRNLALNSINPEWMIVTVLPVVPPDLRPMVPLDGGRYAASDFNDLYRRVINRNNRLKRLFDLNAPEVITRNEKRMLQEAVDALFDNSARHGKTVTATTGQKRQLKSLSDQLKGKQGRFRQNLLGKRTDYSGRSVIVVGTELKLGECGLPKIMALELFRPFVIAQLVKREIVHNIRSANRYIESGVAEVWDILADVTKDARVLLNRAPTLHRLGIQAFRPILIEGKAIKVHPLVCTAFNADFDGDQMAVHVPLTDEAKEEAKSIMAASRNLLRPADGSPIIKPSQDFVWGSYYLTYNLAEHNREGEMLSFYSDKEAILAFESGVIKLQEMVKVEIDENLEETTVGRLIFNSIIPANLPFINQMMNNTTLTTLVADVIRKCSENVATVFLDDLKNLAIKYITRSGLSWGMDDLPDIPEKDSLIEVADEEVNKIREQYNMGLLTSSERCFKVIDVWSQTKDKIVDIAKGTLVEGSSVHTIIDSQARGSWAQMAQMMGMRGNLRSPSGELIELPVKASFKDGLHVLEYFISTHGARKGLSDIALRTASAGYLTRRLIDVSQDVIISDDRCEGAEGMPLIRKELEIAGSSLESQLLGRTLSGDLKHPKNGRVMAKADTTIDHDLAKKISGTDIDKVYVRSLLTCKTVRGVCQTCYGWDMGYNEPVKSGTAVGIIAAQSIGEPGTQLTMRTFHTGGVGGLDITQGLPRVGEIFEARSVQRASVIAPIDGQVTLENVENSKQKIIKITGVEQSVSRIAIKQQDLDALQVKDGANVKKGKVLLESLGDPIKAPVSGILKIEEASNGDVNLAILNEEEVEKELLIPVGFNAWVKTGDLVNRGDQLTEGSIDLHELYALKGSEAVQQYILKEIRYVYSSQGQHVNDKHIEIIARQMFSRVLIDDSGDADFLPGDVLEYTQVREINQEIEASGGKPAIYTRLLLGITKASLSTESFLSAASFQETAKILIDAATTGKVDKLRGLKENVIIGRLIPAGSGFRGHLANKVNKDKEDKKSEAADLEGDTIESTEVLKESKVVAENLVEEEK